MTAGADVMRLAVDAACAGAAVTRCIIHIRSNVVPPPIVVLQSCKQGSAIVAVAKRALIARIGFIIGHSETEPVWLHASFVSNAFSDVGDRLLSMHIVHSQLAPLAAWQA